MHRLLISFFFLLTIACDSDSGRSKRVTSEVVVEGVSSTPSRTLNNDPVTEVLSESQKTKKNPSEEELGKVNQTLFISTELLGPIRNIFLENYSVSMSCPNTTAIEISLDKVVTLNNKDCDFSFVQKPLGKNLKAKPLVNNSISDDLYLISNQIWMISIEEVSDKITTHNIKAINKLSTFTGEKNARVGINPMLVGDSRKFSVGDSFEVKVIVPTSDVASIYFDCATTANLKISSVQYSSVTPTSMYVSENLALNIGDFYTSPAGDVEISITFAVTDKAKINESWEVFFFRDLHLNHYFPTVLRGSRNEGLEISRSLISGTIVSK